MTYLAKSNTDDFYFGSRTEVVGVIRAGRHTQTLTAHHWWLNGPWKRWFA